MKKLPLQKTGEHIHTDECYEEVYTCEFDPEYKHVHVLQCYSNPEADLESPYSWELTIRGVELSGEWSRDIVAIAETQLGYRESTQNYYVDESDGNDIKGITRYGQWYGDNYGDWCAMFVSWCLHYADIPRSYIPYESGCTRWVKQLTELGLYAPAREARPDRGDIIFYDFDQDGLSDHVALVSELSENENGETVVHTIEGNFGNAVTRMEYPIHHPSILGYADLSVAYDRYLEDHPEELIPELSEEEPEETPATAVLLYTDETLQEPLDSSVSITVSGKLPENSIPWAYPVAVEPDSEQNTLICAFAMGIYTENEIEPLFDEPLTVRFAAPELTPKDTTAESAVYLVAENSIGEKLSATVTEEGISFETYSLSAYAWVLSTTEESWTEAAIYTDSTLTQPAEDGVRILVSGELPEGAVICAYPVELELQDHTVICAYDITIYLPDGTAYEPEEQLTVKFIAPQLIPENDKAETAVYYIPEDGEPTRMESVPNDEGISFETDHFSTYAWTNGAPIVYSAYDLSQAINNASSGEETAIRLGADITITDTIWLDKNIIIDLNNHTLIAQNTIFGINNGGVATITDSASETGTGKSEPDIGGFGPRSARPDAQVIENGNGKVTLKYYTVKSDVTNGATGATSERLYESTVISRGMVRSETNGQPLFNVNGGTLNIESGFIYGTESSKRAIDSNNGTVNINGGFILNFNNPTNHDQNNYGGAIRCNGGTLNISGEAVIAGNSAPVGGAIYMQSTCTLNITGGIIACNTATGVGPSYNDGDCTYGGGAVFAQNASVNMSAGYVTLNNSNTINYFAGGGGFLIQSSTMNLSGGYITGNYAASGGGGIRTFHWNENYVYIRGGYVCANYAGTAEGGGVAIDSKNSYCEIAATPFSPVYINNNVTDTSEHWGGGGVFIANDSSMKIMDAYVSSNTAGGFGGGVAGCSTGRIAVVLTNGAAIVDNGAIGTNLSGSGSTKAEDHYASIDPVFMQEGYNDYFCAHTSVVMGGMLGNSPANFHGSCDGKVVDVGYNDKVESSYRMGLSSHASGAAKAQAQEVAHVYINGNYSFTHGGGILANGYLLMGNPNNIDIGDSLELSGEKHLYNQQGQMLPMKEGDFTFEVKDADGALVSVGNVNDRGKIIFDNCLGFTQGGTYVYTMYETEPKDPSVIKDTAIYTITVTVEEHIETISIGPASITSNFAKITHVKLEKSDGGKTTVISDSKVNSDDASSVKFVLPTPTFTNYEMENISITAKKWWAEGSSPVPITVTLTRTETHRTTGEITTSIQGSAELNTGNSWEYKWENLPTNNGSDLLYSYSVEETVPTGYIADYQSSSNVEGVYWVPVGSDEALSLDQTYIIANSAGNRVLAMTGAHTDAFFDSTDTAVVQPRSGTLIIDGQSYTNWLSGVDVSSSMAFVPTAYVRDGYPQTQLRSKGFSSQLLVQAPTGSSVIALKGGSSDYYASSFKLENGKLMGETNWDGLANKWSYIVFDNGVFTVSDSDSNAVRLYKQLSGNMTHNTTVTITNTPRGEQLYTLTVIKEDKDVPGKTLAGAVFRLLREDGTAVSFTPGANGSFIAVSDTPQGAQTDLTTGENGRLVLTNLPFGNYTLREITAPAGYYLTEDIPVTLDTQITVELTVCDEHIESLVLPETGGLGTLLYALMGLLIATTAAYLLYIQTKQKREKS